MSCRVAVYRAGQMHHGGEARPFRRSRSEWSSTQSTKRPHKFPAVKDWDGQAKKGGPRWQALSADRVATVSCSRNSRGQRWVDDFKGRQIRYRPSLSGGPSEVSQRGHQAQQGFLRDRRWVPIIFDVCSIKFLERCCPGGVQVQKGDEWVYSRRLPCHVRPVIAFGDGFILVKEEPRRDIFVE